MRLCAKFADTGRKIGVACNTLKKFRQFVDKHFDLKGQDFDVLDQNNTEILDEMYFTTLEKDTVLTVKIKQIINLVAKCATTGTKILLPFISLENFTASGKKEFCMQDQDITLYDSSGAEVLNNEYFLELDPNSIVTFMKAKDSNKEKSNIQNQEINLETLKTVFPSNKLKNGDHVRMMGKVKYFSYTIQK